MRKIEAQMVAAIESKEDFKLANTQVQCEGNISRVFLYGNQIATIGENFIQLFDGGHQTTTTKSRLNAILSAFGLTGERVFQKGYNWFVQYEGGPIPFFSGMRLN
jgi:hypothetical protein